MVAVFEVFAGEMNKFRKSLASLITTIGGDTFDSSCCGVLESDCFDLRFSGESMFEFKCDLSISLCLDGRAQKQLQLQSYEARRRLVRQEHHREE